MRRLCVDSRTQNAAKSSASRKSVSQKVKLECEEPRQLAFGMTSVKEEYVKNEATANAERGMAYNGSAVSQSGRFPLILFQDNFAVNFTVVNRDISFIR